jgi:hypothetical protein
MAWPTIDEYEQDSRILLRCRAIGPQAQQVRKRQATHAQEANTQLIASVRLEKPMRGSCS